MEHRTTGDAPTRQTACTTGKSGGGRYASRKAGMLVPLVVAAAVAARSLPLRGDTPESYIGADQGLWSNAANWSGGLVPQNSTGQTFAVTLDQSTALTVQLDTPTTIDSLSVSSLEALDVLAGIPLFLAEGSLQNSGDIVINSTGALVFQANGTISGGGEIQLVGPMSRIALGNHALANDNLISGAGSVTGISQFSNSGTVSASTGTLSVTAASLTNSGSLLASGGTLSVGASSISNMATLSATAGVMNVTTSTFTNTGMVTAYSSIMSITASSFTNTGTILSSGGTISLQAQTINNTGETIEANGGLVNLGGSLLSGGTLTSLGAGSITSSMNYSGVSFAGVVTIGAATFGGTANTNTGTVTLLGGNPTRINAQLDNSGVFVLGAFPNFLLNADLSGGGTLQLLGPVATIALGGTASVSSDNTIIGTGTLTVGPGLVNTGSIIATGLLTTSYSSNFINDGLLRADGGTLAIQGGNMLNNSAGVIDAIDGGIVTLSGQGITGGTLGGNGGSVVLTGSTSELQDATINGIVVSTVFIGGYGYQGSLTLAGTTHVNGTLNFASPATSLSSPNGTISIDNEGLIIANQASLTLASNMNLTGGGTLVLQNGILNSPPISNGSSAIFRTLTLAGNLSGYGAIGSNDPLDQQGSLEMLNSGTITASGGVLTVTTTFNIPSGFLLPFTNTGLLRAATGGTLVLNSEAVNNTNGIVEADDGSEIDVPNEIYGGTITTSGSGVVVLPLFCIPLVSIHGDVLASSGGIQGVVSISQNITTISPFTLFVTGASTLTGGGTLDFPGPSTIMAGSSFGIFPLTIQNPLLVNRGALVFQGAVQLQAPVTLNEGSINLNGTCEGIQGPGTVTAGYLTSDGIVTTQLNVSGPLSIRAGDGTAGTSCVSNLIVSTSTTGTYTGTLNVTDNAFVLEAMDPADKANKIAMLQSAVQSGYNGTAGAWTGTGITSSAVAADAAAGTNNSFHTTLAIVDNGALPAGSAFTSFGGQAVDANSIILVRALVGDSNLDGTVDNTDLVALLTHFGQSGQTQATGDFNGDGTVNNTDLVALLTDYAQSLPGGYPIAPADVGGTAALGGAAAVPEAGTMAMLVAGVPLLLRRRRNAGRERGR